MEEKEQYKSLMSGIIAKQAMLLGMNIAVAKARNIKELTVSDDGKVTDCSGDCRQTTQKLIDEYIALSGQIVKGVMKSVFDEHPTINFEG